MGKIIFLVIILMVATINSGCSSITNSKNVVELIGEMEIAKQEIVLGEKYEATLDGQLFSLEKFVQSLPYNEKKNFVFYILTRSKLDAGYSEAIIEIFKKDSKKIVRELSDVSNEKLKKFIISDKQIESYRRFLKVWQDFVDEGY